MDNKKSRFDPYRKLLAVTLLAATSLGTAAQAEGEQEEAPGSQKVEITGAASGSGSGFIAASLAILNVRSGGGDFSVGPVIETSTTPLAAGVPLEDSAMVGAEVAYKRPNVSVGVSLGRAVSGTSGDVDPSVAYLRFRVIELTP